MKPTVYTVATTHLDTSWCWTLETTIEEYLPKTVTENVKLFEKYPEYRFSFEGSYRYELLEEYYPELFELVKKYIADGRWFVAGSSYENGDVNIPSPEALFRNILYGNDYFDKTFGKRSCDIYLPDCFGFGWALPSVAAHANLKGFTTQKLCWSSAYGIPFSLGKWEGPDGAQIFASPDGHDYNASLKSVRKSHMAMGSLKSNMRKYDLPMTFILHGIGDRGGAPREKSVRVVMGETAKNEVEKVQVISTSTDMIFRDMNAKLSAAQKARLPVWKNELVMTDHGVGGYTSRTAGKRFNRRAEQLADAAERMSVFAKLCGAAEYPQQTLDICWKRIIAHQFHDDIPGTSLAKCYKRNWNDYILSLNQLSEEYRSAVGGIARAMNSSFAPDRVLTVANPLAFARREAVSARVELGEGEYARIYDSHGTETPSQTVQNGDGTATVTFCASVPAAGCAAYSLTRSGEKCSAETQLRVSERSLENARYSVSIDENGDISSVYDKSLSRELLSAPIRIGLYNYNGFAPYPAWELDYKEVSAGAAEYPCAGESEVLERGPARATIKITRRARGSQFSQYISLDADGEFLRVYNDTEWRSLRTLMKIEFPLAASAPKASYDLGLGVIERGCNTKRLYEVPAQNFADVTNADGTFGASIFSDSRPGWDRPTENTLRLTCIHSPLAPYRDAQHMLDFGKNRYSFAVFGHSGEAGSEIQCASAAFLQPLAVFETEKSEGTLGAEASFMSVSNPAAVVRCVKKAQNSEETVIRINEGTGAAQSRVRIKLGAGIESAREIYASEEPMDSDSFSLENGELVLDLSPYAVRSFAVVAGGVCSTGMAVCSAEELPCNIKIATKNGEKADGETIPLELLPHEIKIGGVSFFPDAHGGALACEGQEAELPQGARRLHILAASRAGDKKAVFTAGGRRSEITIQAIDERPGAWDLYSEGECGYIKPAVLGYNSTHAHLDGKDEAAKQLYFFKYSIPLREGARSVKLPDDRDIIILAASTDGGQGESRTAFPLFDELEPRECDYKISPEDDKRARNAKKEQLRGDLKFKKNFAVRRLKREIDQLRKRDRQ